MKRLVCSSACVALLILMGCSPSGGPTTTGPAPGAVPPAQIKVPEQAEQDSPGVAKPPTGMPTSPTGDLGKPGQPPAGIPK
jgi:hypothetical protein